ncbi:MAG: ATP-grasp domain-containing protein [Pseudomonadota bacterium]
MTRSPALIYLDVDRTEGGSYDYRKPHFDAAAKLGYSCITIVPSGHENLSMIRAESDLVIEMDHISAAGILDRIRSLSDRYRACAVVSFMGHCPPGIDLGGIVEAVCRALSLPFTPAQALLKCNNKFLMRSHLKHRGIDSVSSLLINNVEDIDEIGDTLNFPVITKPAFGAGSVLIKKCSSKSELKERYLNFCASFPKVHLAIDHGSSGHSFTDASGVVHEYVPGRSLLVEEYIDGHEGSVECIVYKNKVHPLIVHDKLLLSEKGSTILEHQLITPPVNFSAEDVDAIRRYATDCISALELNNCLVHLEFRLTSAGPKVIEVNPRIGGFYVYKSFEDVAGIDPFISNLKILSGTFDERELIAAQTSVRERKNYYTMFVLYPPRSGYLKEIHGVEKASRRNGVLNYKAENRLNFIDTENREEYVMKFWGTAESPEKITELYELISEDINMEMSHSRPSS